MVSAEQLKSRCYRVVYKMNAIPSRLKEDAAMQVIEDLLRADVLNWEFLADSRIQQKAIDYIRKLNRQEYRNAQYWGDFDTAAGHDDLDEGINRMIGTVDSTLSIEYMSTLEARVKDVLDRLYKRLQSSNTETQRHQVRLAYIILKVILEDTDMLGDVLDPATERACTVGCTKYRGGVISTQYLLHRYPDATRKHVICAKRVLRESLLESLKEVHI